MKLVARIFMLSVWVQGWNLLVMEKICCVSRLSWTAYFAGRLNLCFIVFEVSKPLQYNWRHVTFLSTISSALEDNMSSLSPQFWSFFSLFSRRHPLSRPLSSPVAQAMLCSRKLYFVYFEVQAKNCRMTGCYCCMNGCQIYPYEVKNVQSLSLLST